jgi:4-hydroxy-4-methyl-2-oxoglutarate aldolase
MSVYAVNAPVSVGGMDVCPGDIVHMDESGAVRFPADKLQAVLTNAGILQRQEAELMGRMQNATSAAELRTILG